MTLIVHRAERADALVGRLAEVLAQVPADPFAPDLIAVPSRGVERWIAQTLSTALGAQAGQTDGVCANVAFPSPSRLVREALATASGVAPDDDPWTEHRLPWPLLEVIDDCAGEAWCRTLGRHLGLVSGGVNQGRRMAVAQKLAGLYTAYAAERPDMLTAWYAGDDTDGYDGRLDEDLAWQAELWRRLRRHLGTASPAERLNPACQRLRDEPQVVDLPHRLSIFGPTRLAPAQLAVLDALAAHRELHLWLPHPSDGLWRRVADAPNGQVHGGHVDGTMPARREDPTADLPEHPLVASLGRDAREMQLRLQAHTHLDADDHIPAPAAPDTLLGTLQRELRADRRPDATHQLAVDDTSVQVHACHGRHRQVEVLREVLLGLLADDPTLELRDVIVMCPDIEAYAPLISATFGLELTNGDDGGPPKPESQSHPGHRLTFRLADRSLRQTNPVLGVAARILDLADARLTASEVLDLAAMPPVRRRFRFDEDDLERIGDWVRRAGVRWGLDADARSPYDLSGIAQNTWQHGLDRLLAGVTMDEDDLRTIGTALPLDDVDSTEIDLAGRLAEFVDRLAAAVDALSGEQPLADWVESLTDAVDNLTDVSPRDAWQTTQARATLADSATAAVDTGATTLRLSDVRALLGDRLQGRPTRANFRTGHLTFCTMVPMRSVPHRVVCLLGLDDGVFPRGTSVDGDDILLRRARIGERDRRSEDRQLFLDAILAARERLVIVYTGADQRTGAERPPAVPLGELLDVLDRTATTADGTVPDRVLVRHPLQPFDERNFTTAGLGYDGTFSFDRASYAGALALRNGQTTRPPFLANPLPEPPADEVLELDDLIRFLEHPARAFLKQRLGLRTAEEKAEPSDAVPVAPEPLEQWSIGERMLTAGLRRHTAEQAKLAERLRGEIPPGQLGALLDPIADTVTQLLTATSSLRQASAESIDVSVPLPFGATLSGTVSGVYGDRLVRIVFSRLAAKHRIRAWVQLLALCAYRPERSWQAITVGRSAGQRGQPPIASSMLGAVSAADAQAHLAALVGIYRLGLTRPVPAPPKTCCAYTEKRRRGMSPDNAARAAREKWNNQARDGREIGEADDGDYRTVGLIDFADLWDEAAASTWANGDEPRLFGQLAQQIWTPLLDAELLQ